MKSVKEPLFFISHIANEISHSSLILLINSWDMHFSSFENASLVRIASVENFWEF